jgi:hypothetical protein
MLLIVERSWSECADLLLEHGGVFFICYGMDGTQGDNHKLGMDYEYCYH